ncbi:hypothetical protein [Candidatus Amarolinea dominans]
MASEDGEGLSPAAVLRRGRGLPGRYSEVRQMIPLAAAVADLPADRQACV